MAELPIIRLLWLVKNYVLQYASKAIFFSDKAINFAVQYRNYNFLFEFKEKNLCDGFNVILVA